MRARVVATLALVAAGCGGDGWIVDPDGGVDGGSDASGCQVAVAFLPVAPVAPAIVQARADVLGGAGFLDYRWLVRRGGVEVPFTAIDVSGSQIQFAADVAGIYAVTATVDGCGESYSELNVATSGANQRPVRLRFVPPPGVGVPPQEQVFTIPGGADYSLGTVVLDPGTLQEVTVRDGGGAPVDAYLRFISRTTPDAIVEAWSGAAGAAAVRLAAGRHDVLVVPTAALPPVRIADWHPTDGALVVPPGASWTGTVVDAAGAAVAGARVSLTSGGVPSTIATTDAAGRFAVGWRDAAGPERVVVVPPPGRGLARLDFDLAAPAASTTIRFAAAAPRSLGGVLVQVAGAPATDADVSLVLARAAAATIEAPAAAPLSVAGGQHLVLRTDGEGRLPAAVALAAAGELFVAASGGARGDVDLTAGAGPVLAAAPALAITGRVVDAAGAAVSGAQVRATVDGATAYAGAPVTTATSDAAGGFALSLAPGQRYLVSVVDPTARRASVRATVERDVAGALPPFVLADALRITGVVRATGIASPLRAVGVAALCQLGCAGLERDRPLGETVTDAAGRFAVAVPDPGVMP